MHSNLAASYSDFTHPLDLDVVVLSKQDGHDRLAEFVQTLGESALQNKIKSEDITMDFMDKKLSGEDARGTPLRTNPCHASCIIDLS